jgi:hypothetical protein
MDDERQCWNELWSGIHASFRGKRPVVVRWVPNGWFELVDQLCTAIETTLAP